MNRLTIDLDLRRAIVALNDQTLLTDPLALKRGNPEGFEIQFAQEGEGVDPAPDAITVALKNKISLATTFLANTSDFTKTGTGATAVYSGTLSLDTTELGVEFTTRNEPANLAMFVEVIWSKSGVEYHTQLLPATVENALLRGTEAAATANSQLKILTDASTVVWQAPGAINTAKVTLGGNRTLSITGAKPGTWGSLVVVQDATGGRTLALPSGTATLNTAANGVTILDYFYDGTTFYWKFNSY